METRICVLPGHSCTTQPLVCYTATPVLHRTDTHERKQVQPHLRYSSFLHMHVCEPAQLHNIGGTLKTVSKTKENNMVTPVVTLFNFEILKKKKMPLGVTKCQSALLQNPNLDPAESSAPQENTLHRKTCGKTNSVFKTVSLPLSLPFSFGSSVTSALNAVV